MGLPVVEVQAKSGPIKSRVTESRYTESRGIELNCRVEVWQSRGIESSYRVEIQSRGIESRYRVRVIEVAVAVSLLLLGSSC